MGPAALLAARHRFRGTEQLAEEDPEVLEATYQVAQALAGEGGAAPESVLSSIEHRIWFPEMFVAEALLPYEDGHF